MAGEEPGSEPGLVGTILGWAAGALLWFGLAATGLDLWARAVIAVAVVLLLVLLRRQLDALWAHWARRRRKQRGER